MYGTIAIHVYFTRIAGGRGIPMVRRLRPLCSLEVGTNTSHRMSYVTRMRKKTKNRDNFRSEKNCMQLFVIRNRIRTILVLSYRVRT